MVTAPESICPTSFAICWSSVARPDMNVKMLIPAESQMRKVEALASPRAEASA
jgi:hypothetical protein